MSAAAFLRRHSPVRVAVATAALLTAVVIGALGVGSTRVAPSEVVQALLGSGPPATEAIVLRVRLPVLLLSLWTGAGLGASGAAMQGLLRNPLADPYILGVSGGAGLGAAVVIATHAPSSLLPLAAILGALAVVGLLHLVTNALPGGLASPSATVTLLLTGVIFNALASAAILILYALWRPEQSQRLLFWLMGSLEPARASGTVFTVSVVGSAVAFALLTRSGFELNVLVLGDEEASTRGLDVGRTRRRVFVLASVLVGVVVAFTGLIGFVGLVVPHAMRLWIGDDHRWLIPLSALAGATFLALTDTLARALVSVAGTTIPTGAVTAVLGAPIFLWLLIRSLRRRGGR